MKSWLCPSELGSAGSMFYVLALLPAGLPLLQHFGGTSLLECIVINLINNKQPPKGLSAVPEESRHAGLNH